MWDHIVFFGFQEVYAIMFEQKSKAEQSKVKKAQTTMP
jgi:hypothetical protein